MPAAYASSSGAGVGVAAANVVVSKPSGVASGDLLVALCYANTAVVSWTAPAGWTKIAENVTNCSTAVFTRTADGSEGATFTFTRSGAVNTAGATVTRVTGAASVPAAAIGFDTGTTLVLPTVTAAGADTLLLQLVGRVSGGSSWTPPGTAVERYDFDTTGTALTVAGGDEVVGAGATGTRTWTMGAAANSRGAALAISPASTPLPSGAVSGAYDFSGSATGQQPAPPPSGAVSGTYDFSGSATGNHPGVPPASLGRRGSGGHIRFGLRAGLRSRP